MLRPLVHFKCQRTAIVDAKCSLLYIAVRAMVCHRNVSHYLILFNLNIPMKRQQFKQKKRQFL